jgi:O-antigen/teichoic acid export membrane protein
LTASHFTNATWSGISAAYRAFGGLLNALLAVRLVGVEGYGHLTAILSVFVLYLAINTSFYTTMVAGLMSPSSRIENPDQAQTLASASLITALSIGTLICVTALIVWYAPVFLRASGMTTAFALMCVLVTCQILVAFQSAIIEATGRLDLAMKAQLFGPTIILAFMGTAFLFDESMSVVSYLATLCIGAFVDLSILWFVRRCRIRLDAIKTRQRIQWPIVRKLLRAGGLLQATSLMGLFLEPMNKVLLSHFVGPVAVTSYDLAMKIIWGIQGLFVAAMRGFLHLAHYEDIAFGFTYLQTISLIAVPAILMHGVGAILLAWVAQRWVDLGATEIVVFFAISSLSNLAMITVLPLYTSLISRGDLGFILKTQVILAVVNVAVAAVAIPVMGLLGATLGLLSATAYNVMAIYLRHSRVVGKIVGVAAAIHSNRWRLFLATGLLAASVIAAAMSALNMPWTIGLLACSLALAATEALPRRLLTEIIKT